MSAILIPNVLTTAHVHHVVSFRACAETPNRDNPSAESDDRAFRENNAFGAKGAKGDVSRKAVDGDAGPDGAAIGTDQALLGVAIITHGPGTTLGLSALR